MSARSSAGREHEPLQRIDQFAAVIGRRGGKCKAIATVATYIAGLCDHRDALWRAWCVACVALDQRVAKNILDYAEACFERSPILKQLIANRTVDALELTNGISLEVRPASFRKLRGPTSPSSGGRCATIMRRAGELLRVIAKHLLVSGRQTEALKGAVHILPSRLHERTR